jgi:hypothetical protein
MFGLGSFGLQKVLITSSRSPRSSRSPHGGSRGVGLLGSAAVARLLSATDAEVVAVVRAHGGEDEESLFHAARAGCGAPAPVLLRRLRIVREGPGRAPDRVELSDVTHVVDVRAKRSSTAADAGPHACAARFGPLPRLERFLTVQRTWLCGATPAHLVHESECSEAMGIVVDRLAASVLRLLAEPRLAHTRHRLSARTRGGSFDAAVDACTASERLR